MSAFCYFTFSYYGVAADISMYVYDMIHGLVYHSTCHSFLYSPLLYLFFYLNSVLMLDSIPIIDTLLLTKLYTLHSDFIYLPF